MLYSTVEAAETVRLSPATLQNYAKAHRTSLVRGEDYVVHCHQFGPYKRRRLWWTDRGIKRLVLRDYKVFSTERPRARAQQFIQDMATTTLPAPPKQRPLASYNPFEQRMRLKQAVITGLRRYVDHPCAIPNCPCSIHTLGVPQADVIASLSYRR